MKRVEKRPLTTERQRELMRVITECFDKYYERQQHYYMLDGMSTAHVTVHAIGDFVTLQAFWPKELIRDDFRGRVYMLEDETMTKVQSAVRTTLEQLEEKGHIERMGNEHERRWRPVREARNQTKAIYDAAGNKLGMAELIKGEWVLGKSFAKAA